MGSGFDVANLWTVSPPPAVPCAISGVLAKTFCVVGAVMVSVKGVLKPGSSKDGNMRRASIGSNCVQAYQASPTFARYRPSPPVMKGAS